MHAGDASAPFDYRGASVAKVAANLAIDAARRKNIDVEAVVAADPSDAALTRLALVAASRGCRAANGKQ